MSFIMVIYNFSQLRYYLIKLYLNFVKLQV